jgi:hypothetical protein
MPLGSVKKFVRYEHRESGFTALSLENAIKNIPPEVVKHISKNSQGQRARWCTQEKCEEQTMAVCIRWPHMAAPKTNKMSCGRCAMHTHDVNEMLL